MSSNWAMNLDMLAQAGVIDFDAPSYITGQSPRYVGNPASPNPFIQGVPQPKLPEQPQVDDFKHEVPKDNGMVKNPSWKKWLFGALALGGLIFGGYKCRNLIKSGWTKLTNFLTGKTTASSTSSGFWKSTKDALKKGWDATKDFFVKGWNKVTNFFSKKKTTP